MDAAAADEGSPDDAICDMERFYEHVAKLKPSQQTFVALLSDWIQRRRSMVVVVSGGPGTGKTFTVVETLKHTRLDQLKMAYAARIANKIGGRTIHSTLMLPWGRGSTLRDLEEVDDLEAALEQSEKLLSDMICQRNPDVVVIDEVGMVPFFLTYRIIEFFARNPVLVVLMGDSRQLKPVKSRYNLFGALEVFQKRFETHRIDMTESMRFVQEYDGVVERLRVFVDLQDEEGMIDYLRETFPIVETLEASVLARCSRAMAHKNETVDAYNKFYIKHLPGERVRLYRVDGKRLDRSRFSDLKPNCDVFVTENGLCTPTASNGTPLVFLRYDANRDVLVCKDDGQRTVSVERNRNGMFPVTPGFAGTVHKFQGDTLDDKSIAFNFDGCRDLNLVYTALSRVRCMDQICAVVL